MIVGAVALGWGTHRVRRGELAGSAATLATATVTLIALALAAGASSASASDGAARPATHHPVVCQHRRGHTILHRGEVRVYKTAGPIYPAVYGCIAGSTRAVLLWEVVPGPGPGPAPETSGSVRRVTGPFVAVETSTSDQYEYNQSLEAIDLRSGSSYAISGVAEPIDEPVPESPRLETYVLAADGRAAALYATFPPGATTEMSAAPAPTGQLLEVRGFHSFHQVLATPGPNTVAPASLAFNGQTASWTQNGEPRSASA